MINAFQAGLLDHGRGDIDTVEPAREGPEEPNVDVGDGGKD